jgi:hypothetical protein
LAKAQWRTTHGRHSRESGNPVRRVAHRAVSPIVKTPFNVFRATHDAYGYWSPGWRDDTEFERRGLNADRPALGAVPRVLLFERARGTTAAVDMGPGSVAGTTAESFSLGVAIIGTEGWHHSLPIRIKNRTQYPPVP